MHKSGKLRNRPLPLDLAGTDRGAGQNDIGFELDQLLHKHRKLCQIAIGISVCNDVVPASDVPELLHSQWKSTAALSRRRIRACEEKADHCALPLARYFCKRLQKMYGLGEPP
jgi:hypothetical protein